MKKFILFLSFLLLTSCAAPIAVTNDLTVIKSNVELQKQISEMLLDSIKIANEDQLDAVVQKKVEIQQQYDLIIEAIDRLQRYFQVESKIDLGQIDAYQQLQELLKGMTNAK